MIIRYEIILRETSVPSESKISQKQYAECTKGHHSVYMICLSINCISVVGGMNVKKIGESSGSI